MTQLFSTFVPALKSIHYKKFVESWEKSHVYLEFFKVEDNSLLMAVRNWGKSRDENTILSYEVTEKGNTVFKEGPVKIDKQYFESHFSIQERVEYIVETYLLNFKNTVAENNTSEHSNPWYDSVATKSQPWA